MSATTSPPLRPQFFVTRQNGAMVPLIAADELPPDVVIRDVSRNLSPHDVAGMTAVGPANARHRQYVVQTPPNPFTHNTTVRDHTGNVPSFGRSDSRGPSTGDLRPLVNRGTIFPGPPKAFGIEEQVPSTVISPAPVSNGPLRVDRKAVPASLPPWHNIEDLPLKQAPGMKEYCSYWLRHGECDYAQQGCLYKHEMPLDRGVLERLGLRDIPRWYREKHGLGSYLAGTGTLGATSEPSTKLDAMDKNWRSRSAGVARDISGRKNDMADVGSTVSVAHAPDHTAHSDRIKPSGVDSRRPGLGFGARGRSDVQRSDPPPRFYPRPSPVITAPAPARAPTGAPTAPKESLRGRQMRETIQALDAYEQQERDRKALADKYKILQPVKRDNSKTSTPMTPTTSSDSMDCSGSSGNGGDSSSSGSSIQGEEAQAKEEPRSPRMRPAVRADDDSEVIKVKLESRSSSARRNIRPEESLGGAIEKQQEQQQQRHHRGKNSRRQGGRRDRAGSKEGTEKFRGKKE